MSDFNENSSQLPPPQLPVQSDLPLQNYDEAGRSPRRRFGVVLVAAVFGLFGGIIGTYIAQEANLVDLDQLSKLYGGSCRGIASKMSRTCPKPTTN
jgi:hypothetical protein